MSQKDLAKRANIGRSTISNIENDKYVPGVDIALAISGVLKCKVEDLFRLTDESIDK